MQCSKKGMEGGGGGGGAGILTMNPGQVPTILPYFLFTNLEVALFQVCQTILHTALLLQNQSIVKKSTINGQKERSQAVLWIQKH